MTRNEGGCLCGRIRYATRAKPRHVIVCHCRFCQKATGSAYMVEPIFGKDDFALLAGSPKLFDQSSKGSGKIVHVHFCGDCGTKLWLSFERFPRLIGVYAGTFDEPCWFAIEPASAAHIFVGVARLDTVVPAGLPTYIEHASTAEGVAQKATVYEAHHKIGS